MREFAVATFVPHAGQNITSPTSAAITTGGLAPVSEQPQVALVGATAVQRIGQRNLIGIIVAAVLVFLGLVLWLSFGRWPRAGMRRIRARLARGDKRAAKSAASGAGGGGGGAGGDSDESFGSAPGHERDDKRGDGAGEVIRQCESPLPAAIEELDSLDRDGGGTDSRHVRFA
ncbi:uncharacterized protein TRAVEDRAFT_42141 [Trametes versicolor FP-101664 SS1]|uniref:uncharacterized protein n=1 Tax=Trametes versicolor (strain FP-101664) TaxID=717944 RepID=UPI0004624399|nr:uncharacterized protein TRAVEDRAFT_42141 [Trametes versicolor FP-101664 SS1]EIW64725.1 hypothetical protein TRAVEDRAFT_42141 [Trametes versicolor FP-101664 SS1]